MIKVPSNAGDKRPLFMEVVNNTVFICIQAYLVYLRSISNRLLMCVLQQKKVVLAKVNDAEREM